jgi:hypothetical protein
VSLGTQKPDAEGRLYITDRGEIIERVLEAGRGICLPDMSELPSAVCFPFMEPTRPGGAIVEPLQRTAGSPMQCLDEGTWLLLIVTPVPRVLTSSDYRWIRALCH